MRRAAGCMAGLRARPPGCPAWLERGPSMPNHRAPWRRRASDTRRDRGRNGRLDVRDAGSTSRTDRFAAHVVDRRASKHTALPDRPYGPPPTDRPGDRYGSGGGRASAWRRGWSANRGGSSQRCSAQPVSEASICCSPCFCRARSGWATYAWPAVLGATLGVGGWQTLLVGWQTEVDPHVMPLRVRQASGADHWQARTDRISVCRAGAPSTGAGSPGTGAIPPAAIRSSVDNPSRVTVPKIV